MNEPFWLYSIGFLAQGFFSARILVQWIMSEKAHKVLSPSLFWVLSLLGSYLLCIYGWLRNDFAIVLGQVIAYYIYIWNLSIKGILKSMGKVLTIVLLLTPVIVFSFLLRDIPAFVHDFFKDEMPVWLVIFGSVGQVLFTLRFSYQWYYSYRIGKSELPAGFWIISLVGSLMIVSYGVIRLDPVIIIGQAFGLVAYIRNIMIGSRQKRD